MYQTHQAHAAFSPKTYLERGTAAPFTAPLLAGARLRNGFASSRLRERTISTRLRDRTSGTRLRDDASDGVEMLLPSLSGKRGLYVLPWHGIIELCRPTMHDCLLYNRLAVLDPLTPMLVRTVASALAAQGYAGEAAQAAAERSARASSVRVADNAFRLTLALVDQILPMDARVFPHAPHTPAMQQHGKQALLHFAILNRCTPRAVLQGLAELADLAEPLGLLPHDAVAWAPRLVARLRALRASMQLWRGECPEPTTAALAEALAEAAGAVARYAADVLAAARATVLNVEPVLRLAMAEPEGLATLLARPLWVLDGWDQICLLWEAACEHRYQRAALLEISQILPQQPFELSRWLSTPLAPGALEITCQVTSINDAWRTGGAAFALVARNEQLRARAA